MCGGVKREVFYFNSRAHTPLIPARNNVLHYKSSSFIDTTVVQIVDANSMANHDHGNVEGIKQATWH